MPCDSVVRLTIDLAAACKNPDLLAKAIEALGGRILSNANGVINAQLDGDRIEIRNGQVTGRYIDEEKIITIQKAYGLQSAKAAAKKAGWSFTATSATKFELTKRSL